MTTEGDPMNCEKCNQSDYWFFDKATNEDGWRCGECQHKPGEPAGFCPQLDRDEIGAKVDCLLRDLHDNGFLHVSNGSCGEGLVAHVAGECRTLGKFDQYTICQLLFAANESHGQYWQKVSYGVLTGNDTRNRCPCGAISMAASSKPGGGWEYRCRNHAFAETVF
jgi:hypothetical protein